MTPTFFLLTILATAIGAIIGILLAQRGLSRRVTALETRWRALRNRVTALEEYREGKRQDTYAPVPFPEVPPPPEPYIFPYTIEELEAMTPEEAQKAWDEHVEKTLPTEFVRVVRRLLGRPLEETQK